MTEIESDLRQEKESLIEQQGWAVIEKRPTTGKSFVCSGEDKIVFCKTKERAEWWAGERTDFVEYKVVLAKITTIEE